MRLFPKSQVVGVFRGFREGGLEFHADLALPYRNDFQRIPMHGHFVLVQLETPEEAVLGRIASFSSEGKLSFGSGEEFNIRAVQEERPIPEDLREQYLKYRVNIRVLGVLRNGAANRLTFVPSHRRLPHVGSAVAFLSGEVLKEVCGHNIEGAEIGHFALGEYIYAAGSTATQIHDLDARRGAGGPGALPDRQPRRAPQLRLRPRRLWQVEPEQAPVQQALRGDPDRREARRPQGAGRYGDLRPGRRVLLAGRQGTARPLRRAAPAEQAGGLHPAGCAKPLLRLVCRRRHPARHPPAPPERRHLDRPAARTPGPAERRQAAGAVAGELVPPGGPDRPRPRRRRSRRDRQGHEPRPVQAGSRGGRRPLQHDQRGRHAARPQQPVHGPAHQGARGRQDLRRRRLADARRAVLHPRRTDPAPDLRPQSGGVHQSRAAHHPDHRGHRGGAIGAKRARRRGGALHRLGQGGAAKYDLGALLITQQPGSIPSEILSQGDNWFIFHLLSAGDPASAKRANAHFSDDLLSSLLNEPIPGQGVFWSSVGGKPYPVSIRALLFEDTYKAADPSYARPAVPTFADALRRDAASVVEQARRAGNGAPPEASAEPSGEEFDEDANEGGPDLDLLYRESAVKAIRDNQAVMQRLSGAGAAWGHLLKVVEAALPDSLDDRFGKARDLVKPTLDAVFGMRDRDWHTVKHPDTGKVIVRKGPAE